MKTNTYIYLSNPTKLRNIAKYCEILRTIANHLESFIIIKNYYKLLYIFMIEYISYILFLIVIIVFIIYIYIRIKYGFWMIQPVFHIYNLNYILNPPGIICEMLPDKNKYTNFKDIHTIYFSDMEPFQSSKYTRFIQTNYLQNKDNYFSPKFPNISSYFIGHNEKTFISFYYKTTHLLDMNKHTTIPNHDIIGTITSRPLNIFMNNEQNERKKRNNEKNEPTFKAYYVDYLCVHKEQRKKGIAPQLIQTHHYNQRHKNKNIVVSLFKREDELTGIVPLCVYSTYGFSANYWTKPNDLSSEYTILEINPQNFRFIYNFIRENQSMFDIVVYPDISNMIELIKTKNIFIYALLCDDEIICCYFYRKTCVFVDKGLEVLSCFASICNDEQSIFIQGFKISFWKIASEHYFGFCAIENISHNDIIIDNIKEKTEPLVVSPTAYFFYNFAYPTFNHRKVLMIN